nr:radical SAM protein [uncultured Porphyromonas sp.]
MDDKLLIEPIKEQRLGDLGEGILQTLEKGRFVCDTSIDEYYQIIRLQRILKYGNKNARLTILPTLNCNFNCWYCYEEHSARNMTKNECRSLLLFCDNLVKSNKLNTLTLDWFGGEPMLMFYDVVVPLSSNIQELCEKEGLTFFNMMTTNGALIQEKHLEHINEIRLNKFQITLDGGAEFHNRTRFSKKHQNSYDQIVSNIIMLVEGINDVDLTLRINCTTQNINSIESIIDSFPISIRPKIHVNLQPIWQEVESLKSFSCEVMHITSLFHEKGFSVPSFTELPQTPNLCYVENMLQYTIIPGLEVYKCTARDFKKGSSNYIGEISSSGIFNSNDNILRYYANSFFENNKCKECDVLPVCRGNCIQKCVEGNKLMCQKELLTQGVDSIILGKINRMYNNK